MAAPVPGPGGNTGSGGVVVSSGPLSPLQPASPRAIAPRPASRNPATVNYEPYASLTSCDSGRRATAKTPDAQAVRIAGDVRGRAGYEDSSVIRILRRRGVRTTQQLRSWFMQLIACTGRKAACHSAASRYQRSGPCRGRPAQPSADDEGTSDLATPKLPPCDVHVRRGLGRGVTTLAGARRRRVREVVFPRERRRVAGRESCPHQR